MSEQTKKSGYGHVILWLRGQRERLMITQYDYERLVACLKAGGDPDFFALQLHKPSGPDFVEDGEPRNIRLSAINEYSDFEPYK